MCVFECVVCCIFACLSAFVCVCVCLTVSLGCLSDGWGQGGGPTLGWEGQKWKKKGRQEPGWDNSENEGEYSTVTQCSRHSAMDTNTVWICSDVTFIRSDQTFNTITSGAMTSQKQTKKYFSERVFSKTSVNSHIREKTRECNYRYRAVGVK